MIGSSDRSIDFAFNFFENETRKKTIFYKGKIKEVKIDFGFLVIDRFRVRKWDKAVFHKEEIEEFKIDFGFLAINQFPVQFFRKRNWEKAVFHKGKIGEVEVRWIFSNRSISRPIFSRTKMEKGYFPKGRVEVGWIQRSIDFACNSKFSSGKGKWKKSLFSKSQISLDIVSLVGNPWPGRGLFLWGRVFLEGLDCCTIQRIGRGRVMAR